MRYVLRKNFKGDIVQKMAAVRKDNVSGNSIQMHYVFTQGRKW